MGGVATAFLVLNGAMMAYRTITAITNALETVKAARLAMTTVATGAQTTATFAQTAAQYGLNAALMACPLTWIIILIIALVALFYAAVAAVNHFAGTSVSATGLICGAFMAALAFIGNIFVALWNLVVDVFVMIYNLVATVANFIGNVFNDPVGAVAVCFSTWRTQFFPSFRLWLRPLIPSSVLTLPVPSKAGVTAWAVGWIPPLARVKKSWKS